MPKVAITQNGRIELAIVEALDHLNLQRLIRNRIVAIQNSGAADQVRDCEVVSEVSETNEE